jgi:hypothetical protein
LPKVIGALEAHQAIVGTGKGQAGVAALGRWRGSEVERNFEEGHLDDNHQQRL